MNIIFYLGSMNNGGAERVVANLCNRLCDNNRLMILTSVRKPSVYYLDERIVIKSLDRLEELSSKIITKNIERLKRLILEVREFNADILISFLSEPCFRSLLVKRKIGIPVIICQRNDPKEEYKSFVYRSLMKWLYPKAEGAVFQTEEQKKFFPIKLQKKSIVIANPVADEYICDDYRYPLSRKIIAVGRLDAQKNFKLLIKAFQEFSKEYPDYTLQIYGEGPEREVLEKLITACDLTNRVFLCGRVKDIKKKLLEAEFFVISSDYEGMPNALIEAMALGIPVISTDCPCGGPAELISNENMGILTPVKNVKALSRAMECYASNHGLAVRYGSNAKKILTKVSPDSVTKRWILYIKEVYDKEKGIDNLKKNKRGIAIGKKR
ncbi:glycosyltransferase [Lachnospiraceae bacterium DSM 108991]|uniref:Glycosyltransferase n=1 Tax=Claveliimonas monacensis TaxID=2779351 RepID=A0ABR9RKG1_9FIRM|nr:glycosyltransferase [Claveliimonas monacensis]MBE5063456.1 glycosyltransferase [Claveliimonas monacensis]